MAFLHLAWIVMTVLRFSGVVVVFAGVVLFGVFFVGGNGRATNGRVPQTSWKGAGPKKGIKIVAVGAMMLLAAFTISCWMPNGL